MKAGITPMTAVITNISRLSAEHRVAGHHRSDWVTQHGWDTAVSAELKMCDLCNPPPKKAFSAFSASIRHLFALPRMPCSLKVPFRKARSRCGAVPSIASAVRPLLPSPFHPVHPAPMLFHLTNVGTYSNTNNASFTAELSGASIVASVSTSRFVSQALHTLPSCFMPRAHSIHFSH